MPVQGAHIGLVLAASLAMGVSAPAPAQDAQSDSIEISNEIFAPRRLPVSLIWTNRIVRYPSSTPESNHLSIENIDGMDVLTFQFAIGGRCALELSPQPRAGDDLQQRRTFKLINPFVVESSRAAPGGPCRAMSNHVAKWGGELDIEQNANGDLVMGLRLNVYGTTGSLTYTVEAERFIARKLVIDHAQIAKQREESDRAMAGLMLWFAQAVIKGAASPAPAASPSGSEGRCRIEYINVPDGRGGMTTGGAKQICD